MKKFNIEVISKKSKEIHGLLSHTGEITVGKFKETFVMPLNSWDIEQYQEQWKAGLERIKIHDFSCLVATVQNLNTKPYVVMWTLYKNNQTVFIQNQLLVPEIVTELNIPINLADFNGSNCYQFVINPRLANDNNEGVNEEGQKISEWSISINDLFEH